MKPERGLRCPFCDRRVGDEVIGVYRTECPRCHKPIEFVDGGQAAATDRDGRPVDVRVAVVPTR